MAILNKALSQIENSKSMEEAFDILEKNIKTYGFHSYVFSLIGIKDSPALFDVLYYKSTYPKAWQDAYIEKKYFFSDPVAQHLLKNHEPFYWSEKITVESMTDEQHAMMAEASSYGVTDGTGFSYMKTQGKFYTLTLATDKTVTKYDKTLLSELYLLGAAVVECYDRIDQADDTIRPSLTEKETYIMTYGAMGKTDSEIAEILGISVNTVRFHWKNLFKKLDCYNRVFAIVRALNLGLVEPNVLVIPTDNGSRKTQQKSI